MRDELVLEVFQKQRDVIYDSRLKWRGRIQGLGIIFVLLAPMVIAYSMFHLDLGIPQTTVNKGQLINPPFHVTQLGIKDSTGSEIDLLSSEKKWRILLPISSTCSSSCLDKLFVSRQVHIRLGNKANRVERWALIDGDYSSAQAELIKDHPRLKFANINPETWPDSISKNMLNGYFLMDQEGFVMMYYRWDQPGGELLKDIKKMLKVTYEK